MTDYHQYRITINGSSSEIFDTSPSIRWSKAAECIEDRGGLCTLERRLITTPDILEMLTDPTGWMVLKNKCVSPWEVFAQVEVK